MSAVQPSMASTRESGDQESDDGTIKNLTILAPGSNRKLTPAFRGKLVTLAILFQLVCAVYEYVAVGAADSDISDGGSYGFREAFRETRRIKTKASYARSRGPSFIATMHGQGPLNSWGVSFLEDTIGGLISGPLGLWRRGEIYVKNSVGDDRRSFEGKLSWAVPVKSHAKYWDNGNPDNCTDVRIYLNGQTHPDEGSKGKLLVEFGFLDYDCATEATKGYFVQLQTAYMGGPLIGDVYSISGTGLYSSAAERDTHIGWFVEDRVEGTRSTMLLTIFLSFLPFVLYLFAMIRINANDVHLLMQADKGSKNWEFHLNNGSELLIMWYPTIGCVGMIISSIMNEQLTSDLVYQLMYGELYSNFGATGPKLEGFAILTLIWQALAATVVYFNSSSQDTGGSNLLIQFYEVVSCRKYMIFEVLGSILPLLTFALPNEFFDGNYLVCWAAIVVIQIVLRVVQMSIASSSTTGLEWENNGYLIVGYTGWSPFMSELAPFLNTLYGAGTNHNMKSNVKNGASFKGNLATAAVIAVPGIMVNKILTAGTASIFIKDVGTQGQNMAGKLTYQGGAFLKLMRPWTSVGDYKVEIA